MKKRELSYLDQITFALDDAADEIKELTNWIKYGGEVGEGEVNQILRIRSNVEEAETVMEMYLREAKQGEVKND